MCYTDDASNGFLFVYFQACDILSICKDSYAAIVFLIEGTTFLKEECVLLTSFLEPIMDQSNTWKSEEIKNNEAQAFLKRLQGIPYFTTLRGGRSIPHI